MYIHDDPNVVADDDDDGVRISLGQKTVLPPLASCPQQAVCCTEDVPGVGPSPMSHSLEHNETLAHVYRAERGSLRFHLQLSAVQGPALRVLDLSDTRPQGSLPGLTASAYLASVVSHNYVDYGHSVMVHQPQAGSPPVASLFMMDTDAVSSTPNHIGMDTHLWQQAFTCDQPYGHLTRVNGGSPYDQFSAVSIRDREIHALVNGC